jgi:hypothetical protein
VERIGLNRFIVAKMRRVRRWAYPIFKNLHPPVKLSETLV